MTPIEKYLDHLDNIFQIEPQFYTEESLNNQFPGVTNIVYQDIPEKGMTTALTYGLSLVKHNDWKFGRPELCISVESQDKSWGQVVYRNKKADTIKKYSPAILWNGRLRNNG